MYWNRPLPILSNSHARHSTDTLQIVIHRHLQIVIHHLLLCQASQWFIDTYWKCLSAQSSVGFSFPVWGWNSFYQNLHPRRVWICFCPYVHTNLWRVNPCCHHICDRNGFLGVLAIPKWAVGECNCIQGQNLHSDSWNGKGPSFTVLKSLKSHFLESF